MQDNLFAVRLPPVNGWRVRQARELNGLTQSSLAEALGIDQTMVAHIERASKQPTSELLETIAEVLGLPSAFFRQQDGIEMQKGSLLFRSKAVMGKKVIAQAHAHCELAFEFVLRLSAHANLIPVQLPTNEDAIEGARITRSLMECPDGPLFDLVRHTEKLGVLVIPLPDLRDCDAFAVWAGPLKDHPIIGLQSGKASDRVRMSVAHELGHLVLHRFTSSGIRQYESEAYQFAAELLMPTHSIAQDFNEQKLTLFRFAELKTKWQVSMQALARRARELHALSDRQYRYLMMQISSKGWRTQEPAFHPLPVEKPRAIRRIAEIVIGQEEGWKRKAEEFCLSSDFVTKLLVACQAAPIQPKSQIAVKLGKNRSKSGEDKVIAFRPTPKFGVQ
jgi:Zn-dependent peptidase ImmA (M78 family)/transcriptional regulator with XRE-family HTH domain